jgi:hypothetical protein
MKNKVAIVIPVWKENPSKFEEISFKQCCRILHKYTIIIVTYKHLGVKFYIDILEKNKNNYKISFFKKEFFRNIDLYSKMLLSFLFYIRFYFLEYILIYQLDCFVFHDDLEKWIDSGYSYIGAPWLKEYGLAKYGDPVVGVGNGGFSLRRVKSHLRVLLSFKMIEPQHKLNNTFFLLNNFNGNEDIFWSNIAGKHFPWFKIPEWEIAARFSVEVQPKYFFDLFEDIPFGCHAWWKYDLYFWKPYIEKFGYQLT